MAIICNGKYTVYIHTNIYNNKKYVGITCRKPEVRWGNNGIKYKYNPYFWSAIQKYGWDNFEHEIIAKNLTKQEAFNFERILILALKTFEHDKGYNLDKGGIVTGRITEETREKMRKSHLGKTLSKEQRGKISEAGKALWKNEEHRAFVSDYLRMLWKQKGFREKMLLARAGVRHDTRNVAVVYQGKIFRNVKDFAETYGLNRYTVNNWLNGNHTMPLFWWENGLRNQEESRNIKIRPMIDERGEK